MVKLPSVVEVQKRENVAQYVLEVKIIKVA